MAVCGRGIDRVFLLSDKLSLKVYWQNYISWICVLWGGKHLTWHTCVEPQWHDLLKCFPWGRNVTSINRMSLDLWALYNWIDFLLNYIISTTICGHWLSQLQNDGALHDFFFNRLTSKEKKKKKQVPPEKWSLIISTWKRWGVAWFFFQ